MRKVPVWKTIADGYSFTFGQLGTIIGLIWLPTVILVVVGYFVASRYLLALPSAIEQGDTNIAGRMALIVMAWSVVSLLFWSVPITAVTRQALGLRHGPALISFRLGAAELRVFGASISIFLILLIVTQGFQALVLHLVGSPQAPGSPQSAAAAGVITLVFFPVLFFLMVRLSFLMVPATVSEGVIGLARSWQLTRGNFWRIVVIGLATLGPLLIVMLIAEYAILGPEVFMPHAVPAGDADVQLREVVAQMRAASPHLPELYGFSFLISPVLMGMAFAPPAIAYLALKEGAGTN